MHACMYTCMDSFCCLYIVLDLGYPITQNNFFVVVAETRCFVFLDVLCVLEVLPQNLLQWKYSKNNNTNIKLWPVSIKRKDLCVKLTKYFHILLFILVFIFVCNSLNAVRMYAFITCIVRRSVIWSALDTFTICMNKRIYLYFFFSRIGNVVSAVSFFYMK